MTDDQEFVRRVLEAVTDPSSYDAEAIMRRLRAAGINRWRHARKEASVGSGRREILEFSGPYEDDALWYVEGHSPVVDEREGGTWFAFEETINRANSILRELGFTNEEIEAAKEVKEIGTCGGCGAYGPLGGVHVRQEECGTYV